MTYSHELKSGAKYLNPSDTTDLNSGAVIIEGGLAVKKKIRSGDSVIVKSGGVHVEGNSIFHGDVEVHGNLCVNGNLTVTGDTQLSLLHFGYEVITSPTSPIVGKAYVYCSADTDYSIFLPFSPPIGRTCHFMKTDTKMKKITLLPKDSDKISGSAYLVNQHDHLVMVYGINSTWHLI